MTSRKLLLASTAFAAVVSAQPAFAQESEEGARGFSEIIVTARKKQESILKVPVVQNVLTAETMETFQVNSLQDITTKIPGLVSGNAVLAIGEQMSLRGVGSNSLDQGVDQSVSLNVDGLQLTHGIAYRAASFDLAQVEVLKGPQALYFGKNSTAGVISFRTADPGDEVEIKAKVGYEFESREKRAELIYSLPISETVGLRLAGFYSDSKGIFKNAATAAPGFGGRDPRYKRVGGGESWMVRGTLLWKPDDKFSARLKVNLVRDRFRLGGMTQLADCPDGTDTLPGAPFSFFHPNEDCVYDKVFYTVDMDPAAFPGIKNNGTPFLNINQEFGTLELNYDVSPEVLLTSVTGYYKAKAESMINGTAGGYAASAIAAENDFKRREFTQELRLDTDFVSPFNFTLGTFYQDGKVSNAFSLPGNTALGLPAQLLTGTPKFDIETISGFGQARFAASDQFEIAAGVRYSQEKRNLEVDIFGTPVPLTDDLSKINSKTWSPELTLTYTPTDTLTVFGALKQAYKSGSFGLVTPVAAIRGPTDDEKVRGGEVGVKSRLMDRALSLDVAGYYYKYTGLQTGVNEPAQGGLPILRTVNVGSAKVYGLDFEAHYRPPSIDGLTLNLAVNWNKTKADADGIPCFGGQTFEQGCTQTWSRWADAGTPNQEFTQANPAPGSFVDPSGATADTGRYTGRPLRGVPLVRAPEWIVNFGFEYEANVGENMRIVFANDNRFASAYNVIFGDHNLRPSIREHKALTIDASLTLHGPDDRWSVTVFGKNLTDKLRPGYGSSFSYVSGSVLTPPITGVSNFRNAAGEDEIGRSQAAGRSIGVTFGVNF